MNTEERLMVLEPAYCSTHQKECFVEGCPRHEGQHIHIQGTNFHLWGADIVWTHAGTPETGPMCPCVNTSPTTSDRSEIDCPLCIEILKQIEVGP